MWQDRILLWRMRRGSREALRDIYDRYGDYLLTVAMNLTGDAASAEDAVQDVFMRMTESGRTWALNGSLKAYLVRCVANRVRDGYRQRRRQCSVGLDSAPQLVSADPGPVRRVIDSEATRLLEAAFLELPDEQREVIVLHLHGMLTFREIAQIQTISTKTALSRYHYGLEKLRQKLKSEVNHEPVR